MLLRLLAVLPVVGILLGIVWANRVEPLMLGMPFALGWIVMWVALTSVIMGIVYAFDPVNRKDDGAPGADRP